MIIERRTWGRSENRMNLLEMHFLCRFFRTNKYTGCLSLNYQWDLNENLSLWVFGDNGSVKRISNFVTLPVILKIDANFVILNGTHCILLHNWILRKILISVYLTHYMSKVNSFGEKYKKKVWT